jgi:hypothetical protein
MALNRTKIISLLVAIVGLGAFGGAYGTRTLLAHSQTSSKVVFDAVLNRKMYSQTGEVGFEKRRHYARFMDGSVEFDVTRISPQNKPIITEILNVGTGEWIFLDGITSSSMTIKGTPEEVVATIGDISEACPENIDVSKLPSGGMILGFKSAYFVEPQPDVTSPIKNEQWIAPDLGCFRLRRVETNGGGLNRNEEIATSVSVGEPANALLKIPFGYVERDPESINKLHSAQEGVPFWHDPALRMFKQKYSRAR